LFTGVLDEFGYRKGFKYPIYIKNINKMTEEISEIEVFIEGYRESDNHDAGGKHYILSLGATYSENDETQALIVVNYDYGNKQVLDNNCSMIRSRLKSKLRAKLRIMGKIKDDEVSYKGVGLIKIIEEVKE